jgi:3-hydroxybutyryl-CoA dehydrogenase
VLLFDAMEGAAQSGRDRIAAGLSSLVKRGKLSEVDANELLSRVAIVTSLETLAPAKLVIEAIKEDLEVKRDLFAKLETILDQSAILATNTSSISITSIARDLKSPGRCVGMHFFNPAPVMKLVEVISGVATDPDVAQSVFETAIAWGKIAVHAKSTPGFIVNRVARAYYAEPLRLCEEQVADPSTLDALFTEGGGFRMGPFELMDLIGHDINYAVTSSVFAAYYYEPRFRPSVLQLELVNAGRLGRKSGKGFYDYGPAAAKPMPKTEAVGGNPLDGLVLGQSNHLATVRVLPSDGRRAEDLAAEPGPPVIVHDLMPKAGGRIGFCASSGVCRDDVARFVATLAALGYSATELPDWPGLVVLRTLAMLANEGFEAVLQGVADEEAVDTAMLYGVNYPKGPIAWAREVGLGRILATLDELQKLTGDPRYRPSLGLRRAASDVRNRGRLVE